MMRMMMMMMMMRYIRFTYLLTFNDDDSNSIVIR